MSQRLQERLARAGITRKSQLHRQGFSRQQANAIWVGDLHRLRLETLERLAHVLGVTPWELFQWLYGESTTEVALQQQALHILEPFLRFWPTAAYAARQNPAAPAQRILPLVQPVFQLLEQWGVRLIGEVGACVPFDPHQHQSDRAPLAAGTPVRITHAGYWWGDRLLLRAVVTPVDTPEQSAPPADAPE
ncbi:MAG: hypothetical protein KatS3mg067_1409 [Thermosynechococcus sp.]|uniref:helix-turn-helix domain-containing protein n=1 Tax=Thermosynechococcus sp. TaxID=2814275 RepID=UPI0021FBE9D0|nr:helix-turn-helix domain-containing protein [Thermosynechococcus sp.]BCX12471.1 MAG: hypothetical protein KatS3mg067_1409 [Thermosynechococcus sp.]